MEGRKKGCELVDMIPSFHRLAKKKRYLISKDVIIVSTLETFFFAKWQLFEKKLFLPFFHSFEAV